MNRTDLTQYDIKPEAMENYLRYNGPHFSEKLAKFAISKMRRNRKGIEPITKDKLSDMLEESGIRIENGQLSDALYVANMAFSDYWNSSITEMSQLAKFVKDYIDDEDGYDGIAFNRYIADCARKGIVIPWEDVL